MMIELAVPEDWSAGQAMAVRSLLQHALRGGHPVVAFVRPDATPEQLKEIYDRVEEVIREAGLAVG
jgi:hypothetical protein